MEKKRLIFDLNGTLFESLDYESRVKSLLVEAGYKYSKEELDRFLLAMQTYEDHFDHYTIEDYAGYLKAISGININEKFIKFFLGRADILAPSKMDPDMIDVIDYLRMSYDMVVLTNFFAYAQYDQMAYLGIAHYFSEVFGGEEVLKPNKEAFLKACKPYSVAECVMIGDDPIKDIEGAKNANLDAIYYNKKGIVCNASEINDIKYLKNIL